MRYLPCLAAMPEATTILICLGVGLLVGLITVLIMKGQLRSVRSQSAAGDYMVPGSFRLTQRHDLFLYRTVTRMERPQNNQQK